MADVRLNRVLSMLGVCSRRDADKLIVGEKIIVNGVIINNLGAKICESDIISYDKKNYCLKNDNRETKVWMYFKKVGLVTTHKDEMGRATVFDDVREQIKEKVISVGRLDINSEGLLLLTNNNDFAKYAESVETGWARVYRVRVLGTITPEMIRAANKGITINGMRYRSVKIKIPNNNTKAGSKNMWCECSLTEGKNREIRKIFDHFGLMVNRLIRIKYGPYAIPDNMKAGEIHEVDCLK